VQLTGIQKLLIIISLVVGAAIWQLGMIFWENYPIINFPPKGRVIVALGDSLTEGVGATSKATGYIGILEERLLITITNKGVRGDTTEDALKRLDRDVLSENPDIVIILLGGNDYLKKIPEQQTFENLHTIITRIQEKGAVVILLGVRGGLVGDKFADDFEKLAEETGSLFVPNILEDIIGNPKLMSDAIHPNDSGYLKVADKIAPTLEGLIRAAQPPQSGE
jgi:lysophospholipase L1-like esterase